MSVRCRSLTEYRNLKKNYRKNVSYKVHSPSPFVIITQPVSKLILISSSHLIFYSLKTVLLSNATACTKFIHSFYCAAEVITILNIMSYCASCSLQYQAGRHFLSKTNQKRNVVPLNFAHPIQLGFTAFPDCGWLCSDVKKVSFTQLLLCVWNYVCMTDCDSCIHQAAYSDTTSENYRMRKKVYNTGQLLGGPKTWP